MIDMSLKKFALAVYACLFFPALFPAAGCAPSRSQYYGELHRRREISFGRWRDSIENEHAPRITGELPLADALHIGLNHSPRFLVSLQMQEEGRGRVMEAYSAALPGVSAGAGYTRLDEAPGLPEGLEALLEQFGISAGDGDRDVYDLSVSISQPLYQGGAISAAQRAARLYAYLGEEMVRGAMEDTIYHISNAYYYTLLSRHLVEVDEASLRWVEAHLEEVKARREGGVARDYDVLRARVEVSAIKASLIESRQREKESYGALLRAMGVCRNSEVVLSDELQRKEFEAPSFEDAVAEAFAKRPDIFRASIEADMSKEAVLEVRSRYLPRLSAFYNYSRRHAGGWDDEWRAGLRLNWTLFDGLAREGAMIRTKAEQRRKELLLADAEQNAIKEVHDALLDLESAEEMVRSQELNLQRAGETQRLAEEGYREGIHTEVELLDARSAMTHARGLYYRALHRQKTAILNLKRARGKLAAEANRF